MPSLIEKPKKKKFYYSLLLSIGEILLLNI